MERKRKDEEKELLKKALMVDAQASSSSAITITSLKPKMEKSVGNNTTKSQKEALKKLVVKRKAATEFESPEIKQKKVEAQNLDEDKKKKEEVKEASKKPVGLLQGYS